MNKLFPQHSDHPLFRYFTDAERRRIEKIGEVKTVRADELLIRARDRDSMLFTVEEGHLDIVGKDSVMATVGPGDVLGEVSFIDDSPRTVSVRAGEEKRGRSRMEEEGTVGRAGRRAATVGEVRCRAVRATRGASARHGAESVAVILSRADGLSSRAK
jgi:hypothetical protein